MMQKLFKIIPVRRSKHLFCLSRMSFMLSFMVSTKDFLAFIPVQKPVNHEWKQ